MLSWAKVLRISPAVAVVVGVVLGIVAWATMDEAALSPDLKKLDWWENTVIYQIYPRSFKDTDGDGIGDLKGITSELEHFIESGVGTIWLSPVFVSPMVDFGYDISNFYDIHPEYGTMADFEELVQRAHELGIRVLLDHVPNHASTESEYFRRSVAKESGYENYFVWADPRVDTEKNRTVPSNWVSQFGGSAWEWNEERQQYYLHQFAVEQADFNFREPAVRQEMLNIMKFWIEKGVDGLRLDALPHLFEANPDDYGGVFPDEPLSGNMFISSKQPRYTTEDHVKDMMEIYDVVYEWRDFVERWQKDNEAETKVLLAEAYANITMLMLYYGDGRGRSGTHFPFNFDLVTGLTPRSSARDFVYVISRWLTYMPHGNVANWVFGNHDRKRMASRFRKDMVDGLNALSMMLPGVTITYQGEEIGMRDGYVSWENTVDVSALNLGNPGNYLDYSRDPARTPYHWNNSTSAGFSTSPSTWLPVAEDYIEINLEAQKEAERSHFKVYQSLTRIRKEAALSHGEHHVKALSENTFVVVRHIRTYDTYALVFNVGTEPDTVDLNRITILAEPLTVYMSSIFSRRINGDIIPLGELTLQPAEALVLRAPPT